jgi:NADPH-dependent 2,4-dienoyl-CoA reductase/sulfur reductase-like enzyme
MRIPYVIVGGGLAGAAAVTGVRAHDATGRILLVSSENHPPYHRPPLSKDLWWGKSTKDKLPYHPEGFYRENGVELALRREIVELDVEGHRLWDDHGAIVEYENLLLATGGSPRRLNVDGADSEGVHYFRYLEDFLALERRVERLRHALVVGGGFIGLELAAALRHAGIEVTLVYPDEYPLRRVLPRELGLFVADYYRKQGVEAVSGERVARIETRGGEIVVFTEQNNQVTTELLIAGIGIDPATDLAEAAGLEVTNGIAVDEYARTTHVNVWAAGDVAEFPCLPLDRRMRVEHWDHAIQHGTAAGANMAGANRPYTHLPFFFSDFFDLGWEAVGELEGDMDVHVVWKTPFREGVLFYLRQDVIRGVLLWNVWDKVEWGRQLIRAAKPTTTAAREKLAAEAAG